MFGMGFTEMLLIAVIAILFLGPDKLPSTMIDIAKFLRNVKNTIGSVKDSLEEELNVSDIKKEALAYKEELLNASESINRATHMPQEMSAKLTSLTDDMLAHEVENKTPKAATEPEEVTFKKKKKKKKEEPTEKVTEEPEPEEKEKEKIDKKESPYV
jgi:sec-independent protein translocase protein TatB